jgi:hypothetical protein
MEVPWPNVTLELPDSVKLGALTLRETVVLAVRDPDVPVIVNVAVPGVAVPLAVSVRTLLPLVGLGAKEAVTPLGSPVTARFTLPVNP